ncbi:MAG: ATP-dependent DNA helicase [Ralstonia sp.]|uniref:ATP-dependent DNA helicase YoaA n=4 Tax=Pseudomonadota TaxID=1224 RepID=A0ABN9HYM3_RALPI|nr:ATP-dependent DNA helicase [Ralstonia sp.]POH88955.1 ATP-dependent DNA helicase [Ralstonia pickettii]MBA4230080.1 ATP-dependent DNA helicase [Ralstonia sp.]MBA4235065.1 ATP-dependent DNA helicase [Ralstonia sp.]MBA4281809.1 ATP-dependent DNA helicase [Ralstonia sp.]
MRPPSFDPTDSALTSLSPLAEPSADSDAAAGDVSAPAASLPADAHHAELSTLFADDGTLAKGIEGYRPRSAQLTMAQAVANAIEAADSIIVEAGTGTGKTYAYLVPAMLWGGKVIVSTGTKNLQDQLFLRDIPTVRKALNAPVSVALLKGRANYVCHYHVERTSQNGRLSSRQDAAWLRQINLFLKTTKTGDKAELASVPENAPVWNLVTSTRDNCLGSDCAYYKDCFVMRARKEAQQADVVVVNHHLFFADVMLKDTGMAELLPAANTIIFDEAHQLPETATLFFGETISTNQILELARDSVAEGLSHARDAVDWVAIAAPLERAARDLRLVFRQDGSRLSIKQIDNDAAIAKPFYEVLPKLEQALSDFTGALEAQAERAETIEQCHRRAVALCEKLEAWVDPKPPKAPKKEGDDEGKEGESAGPVDERVRWVEVFANSVQLHLTPLSIAPIFSRQRAGQPRAWVFTSATLSVRGNFTHYAAQLGLDRDRSMTLDSPFDYASQGLLYVPRDLPQPSDPRFTDAVLDATLPLIEAAGGKTFLLCTTLRAVNRAAERLTDEFAQRGWDYPLLVQGQASRTELLDRFRALGNAVLIGSQSFWEGVDVRGEALSLVVIDKLPFAPPDDPVLSARMEALEKKGLSPFAVHQLPHAVITLKQGAGRLIRSETDRGVLMICDPRLVEKNYGRQIWQSLPPFKRTREAETAAEFLRSLRPDPDVPQPTETDD